MDCSENNTSNHNPQVNTALWTAVGVLALVVGGVSAATLTACDAESCQEIQNDYEQALSGESGLGELTDDGPPHAAMALRLDLVEELTSGAVDQAVSQALETRGEFVVGGETIRYRVSATGADLGFGASSACDGCVDVAGDLSGDVEVDLPGMTPRSVPLSGAMDWTVPLDAGLHQGDVALLFDTEQAVRMGVPHITGHLDGLPDDWTTQVISGLTDALAEAVADSVDPIALVTYEVPELGASGVEVTPSLFGFDEASNAAIVGLRTNLEVPVSRLEESEYLQALSLGEGQNAAVAVQPRLVAASARLALREGYVPRRYTTGGSADSEGVVSVVFDGFDADVHERTPDAVATQLRFRGFNYRSAMMCWTMRGMVHNRFAVDGGRLDIAVEDVEFDGPAGIMEGANWESSRFVEYSERVLSTSLDDAVLSTADYGVELRPAAVTTDAGMVILGGSGSAE